MMKVGVVGASGRTGQYVVQALEHRVDAALHAAIVSQNSPQLGKQVPGTEIGFSADLGSLQGADVIIEFTNPDTSVRVAQWCALHRVPLLVATTGHTTGQLAIFESLASEIPLGIVPNTSIGAAVLANLAGEAKRLLGDSFDIEVLDLHHRMKKDAPSGTARSVVNYIQDDSPVIFGREGQRQVGEIGVVALRGGDAVGDHTVYFLGDGERIEITHRVSTRAVFGQGAVVMALRLVERPKGLYRVRHLIGL